MKFISTSDWKNTDPSQIKVEGDTLHPTHVHKGAFVTIGGDTPFDQLMEPTKQLIALLKYTGRLGDASDKEKVASVQAEAKAELKQREDAKKLSIASGSPQDFAKQLTESFRALASQKAA